jgi:AraC-like DNA-binding protein
MERVFIYAFAVSFLMIWLTGRLRRKTGTERGSGLPGLVPPLIVTAVMLLDDRMLPGGIPAPLLAADMLFLDASVLQGIRFMSERRRPSIPFLLLAAAGPARIPCALAGHPLPLDPTVHMVLVSGMMLSFSVAEEVMRMFPAGRIRGILQEHVALVFTKAASAQGLTLLGVIILSATASRALCLVACVTLALVYAYLKHSVSIGSTAVKVMPVAAAVVLRQAAPDRVTDESRRVDLLFERVEAYMQKERPYLDDGFTLTQLATEMMTNKSMLSKTINDKSGNNFCRYVNSYRVKHALSLMQRDKRLKVSELSMMSGFHTVASFNMAFKLIMNDTPSEYMRTLHSSGLARPLAGERSAPPGSP